MKPDRTVDARGAACPGPAVMVAQELDEMEPGQVLEALVDSKSVAEDVAETAREKGHEVLSVEESDDGVRLLIRVSGEESEGEEAPAQPARIDTVMIVQSTGTANPERAYATFLIPEAALAMDLNVIIFGIMDGVTVLVEREAERVRHPEFPPLIEKAAELLDRESVEAYACELSLEARGIDPEDLMDGVRVAGAPKFLSLITDPGVRPVWL